MKGNNIKIDIGGKALEYTNKLSIEQRIHDERRNFIINSHVYPDYIMIHPIKKDEVFNSYYGNTVFHISNGSNIIKAFGMIIIWTAEIGEDDIICTGSMREK